MEDQGWVGLHCFIELQLEDAFQCVLFIRIQ